MSTKSYHPTISLINARSVKANLIFILDFINEFNHDIIALTETWFNENDCAVISSLKSTDYNFIQANRVLPVTCYLIGLGTSINFFIEVFGRAFNILLGKNVCFEL